MTTVNAIFGWVLAAHWQSLHYPLLGYDFLVKNNLTQNSTHVGDFALRLHQRWSLHALCMPPLAAEPSRRLLHLFGTVCRSQYGHRRHCKFFAAD